MTAAGKTPLTAFSIADTYVSTAHRLSLTNGRAFFSGLIERLKHSLADGSFFFGIAVVAVWIVSRPFEGVDGDARVYMARALADLDPAGVGRDLMFVLDGQSQFSIFAVLADRLVAMLNPGNAAFVFALANLVCWLSAASFLVSRFAEGRMKWAILMIVAALPAFYGPFQLLRFAEQYATPRPLAEACVLAALAFLIDKRRALALVFLALAAAFHPIMALPGVLVFAIDLCRADRRWIALGLGLGLLAAAAGLCGLPLFNRLTTLIDPDWLTLLHIRNSYLFPALWPLEPFACLGLQIATIVLAADLVPVRVRFIFLSVAGVGAGGIVLAFLFGDLWPVLLVVQAQLWRASWLTAVIAAMSLALCVLNARRRSPRLELASAFLVLGWLFYGDPVFASTAAAIALVVHYLRDETVAVSRRVLNAVWALVVLAGVISKAPPLLAFVRYVAEKPADYHAPISLLWSTYLLSIPIAVFALIWVYRQSWIPGRAMGLLAFGAVIATGLLWDDRQLIRKITDTGYRSANLTSLFPADHSEIYWMGGTEPWYLLGHPSWALRIQGAGIVFSRPLAMLWQERIKALLALHFIDGTELAPWAPPLNTDVELTRGAVDQLCARADAPSTIVAPFEEGSPVPADLKFRSWVPPAPEFRLTQQGMDVQWHRWTKYLILSCADHAVEVPVN